MRSCGGARKHVLKRQLSHSVQSGVAVRHQDCWRGSVGAAAAAAAAVVEVVVAEQEQQQEELQSM